MSKVSSTLHPSIFLKISLKNVHFLHNKAIITTSIKKKFII